MFKKTLTGACSFLLLLNPFTATAATTLASTEDQTVATSENTQESTQETAEGTTTSEMTVDSTTASGEVTSETTSSSESTTSSSEASTSSNVSETTTATDSSDTTESSDTAESTSELITESSTHESTEEATTQSSAEKDSKTTKLDDSNPHLSESYDPTISPGPQVDVGSVNYFRDSVVDTYPLGIGTHFTAFAGRTIYFTGQRSPAPNYDGTYAADSLDLNFDSATYYRTTAEDPDPTSWRYPFSYTYTADSAIKTAPLGLIGRTYGENNTQSKMSLTALKNFEAEQGFLFEDASSTIPATTYDANNTKSAEDRTPVQNKIGDILDFRDNLGVQSNNELYDAKTYFSRSKTQLQTVSNFYKSFTDDRPAVGNGSVDSSIKAAKYVRLDNDISELQVEVPVIAGSKENAVAIFDLSKKTLGVSDFSGNNSMKIQLDNVDRNSYSKKTLPFIIFNWNDWTELRWSFDYGNMTFVDKSGHEFPADFYKTMGSHIIHNFPNVTNTLSLGIGKVDFPFTGTMLVPNGSITLENSNSLVESFWGSLIAGVDITLKLPISKEKAFGSIFDAENLPDFNETTLKLTFTDDKVTSSENKAQNTLNIYGDQNEYTVEFTRKDQVDPTKELPVNVMADESQGDASSSLTGLAPQKDIPFTVDTTGWEPGTYTITGTVTDKNGQSTTAEFTIVVQGILSLDAVPNLNFGTFKLGTIGNGSINHIQNFKVETGNSSEANQDGLIKITDSRNGGEGGNWSLNVTMTPFSREGEDDSVNAILNLNVQQDIDQAKIISLKIKSDELQTGDRLNHLGNDQETTNETFNILTDEENSSTLEIADSITNLGTYQSTLTWTLSDLPKSDEISDN